MSRFTTNQLFDGRYRLEKKIGKGGYAEVWKATDVLTSSEIALKVLSPDGGLSEGVRSSYINEFVNTLQLSHPNLLRPFHYGQFEDHAYVVMPLCINGSLEDAVVRGKTFTEEDLAKLLFQASEGLDYIHGKGILHNDIKPGNILVSDNGDYQLADFGISSKTRFTVVKNSIERSRMEAENKKTSSALSIAYAATELYGETPINTAKSDVFSLGVTIYELATGKLPWMGEGGKALSHGGSIPNLPSDKYSGQFNQLFRTLLDTNPSNRPSAKELAQKAKFFVENGFWGGSNQEQIEVIPSYEVRERKSQGLLWGIGGLAFATLMWLGYQTCNTFTSTPKASVANNQNTPNGQTTCSSPILEKIKASPEGLIIAKESDAPPMFWCSNYDTLNNCQGFEYELGQMIAGKLGLDKVSYAIGAYEDLPGLVTNGKAHLVLAGFVPDNEIQGIDWSDSYLDFGLCLIVKKGSPIKDLTQLARIGKKVVVYEGDATALEWAQSNIKGAEIIEKADPEEEGGQWLKAVESGELDAAIYDYPFAIAELAEYYPSLQIVKVNLNASNYAIGLPKDNLCFKEKVNQAINEIKESTRYADLVKKYLKSDALAVVAKFEPNARIHIIQKGETLSTIARDKLGDMTRWKEIYELNKDRLPNPHLIFENNKIVLPQK